MWASTLTPVAANAVITFNARDLDRAVSVYAPDYEGMDVAHPGPHHGPEGVRQAMAEYLSAFPDLTITQEDLIQTGDRIVQIWTARGTHRGPLMNIPPTGRSVTVRGISVLTMDAETGRVCRGYYLWDVAGLLRSIGLLPEL